VSLGLAPRQSRSYRDIFQLVKEHLARDAKSADNEPPERPDDDDRDDIPRY
jgi:hypothetical protein